MAICGSAGIKPLLSHLADNRSHPWQLLAENADSLIPHGLLHHLAFFRLYDGALTVDTVIQSASSFLNNILRTDMSDLLVQVIRDHKLPM